MGQCYSAIDICAMQVNRLDCDGNILNSAANGDVVVTCGVTDITITPQTGEERNNRDPNGQGGFCAERIIPATITGQEVELTLCSKTDVELMELLGLYDTVNGDTNNPPATTSANAVRDNIGIKSLGGADDCLCDPPAGICQYPGVAIHLWHTAWLDKERHPSFSWVVEALPKVVFDPASTVIQRNSEFNTVTITGQASVNDNYGTGPGGIWPDVAFGASTLDRDWAEWLTNTRPDGMCSCDMCGYLPLGTTNAVGGVAA